jgi:hypothetical protein
MLLTAAYVSEEAIGFCAWYDHGTFCILLLAMSSPAADLRAVMPRERNVGKV